MTTTPTIWQGLTYSGDGIVPSNPGPDGNPPVSERYDNMITLPGGGFILFWADYYSYQGQVYDAEGNRQGGILDPILYDNVARLSAFSRPLTLKDGTTIVAFDYTTPGNDDTDYRLLGFNPDGTLKFDTLLETNTADWPDKGTLDLSALADGGFIATWDVQYFDGSVTHDHMALKRFDADGNVQALTGTPTIFDDSDGDPDNDYNAELQRLDEIRSFTMTNTASQETVIGLAGGGFVALWEDFTNHVFIRFFDSDGVPLVTPDAGFQIDGPIDITDASENIYQLGAAALKNGGIAIAWIENSSGYGADYHFAVYDSAGNEVLSDTNLSVDPGGGDTLATGYYSTGNPISIIALADGGFAFTWLEDFLTVGVGNSRYRIKWQSFNEDGTPNSPQVTLRETNSSTDAYTTPSMLELKDGTILLAWYDGANSGSPYTSVRLDADGNQIGDFFTPIDATPTSFAAAKSPELQLLADGRVLVAVNDNTFTTPFTILDPRDAVINGDGDDNIITSRQDGARVNGLGGDDLLLGQNDDDELFGGGGADELLGRSGNDTLNGGGGNDEADGGGGADTIVGGGGADELNGRGGNDDVSGNAGKDVLRGQGGNDALNGGGGADLLFGNGGADVLNGGGQNDKLFGHAGGDELNGQAGADLIEGGGGKDELNGGSGADNLKGGGGNDRLAGNRGNDTLTGGGGADRYVFAKRDGKDKITDFGGRDKIDLSAFKFDSKAEALLAFHEIGGGNNDVMGFSANGTQIRIVGADLNDFSKADIII